MKRLTVKHLAGQYDIVLGPGARDDAETRALLRSRPVLIVTDRNVSDHWLAPLQRELPESEALILPPGEASKTLPSAGAIWTRLAQHEFGRDVILVALGGGVIGDLAGFAAASWMRGVDFVQLPTTLLSQIDSSVGGKTAINLPEGKNLVGAFHQPIAVLADIDMLGTLPTREFISGFAEIIKAALLHDENFFEWLEEHAGGLNSRTPDVLENAIARSCAIKAEFVIADERERNVRALLNLGHTYAHALEKVTGYARFLHGEAVAIGLVQALALSEIQLGTDTALRPRLVRLLKAFGLPAGLPADIDHESLLDAMRLDKKHVRYHWRLVLLERIGRAAIVEISDPAIVRAALRTD